MNNPRRKEIRKALDLILEARIILEQVADDEQYAFDNLPEGIQYSERGEAIQENADRLEEVTYTLGEMEDELEDIIS